MATQEATLADRLLSAYKQALIYIGLFLVYSIIALIVFLIGLGISGNALTALTSGGGGGQFIIGIFIFLIGYLLFFVGAFAAYLFAATRGYASGEPLGFIEAYVVTFKLILELAVVVGFALVLFILGGLIGGGFGGLLNFVGGILIMLFPAAAGFYVLNWIVDR